MKKTICRITGILLILAMLVSVFAACSKTDVERPKAASIKTDLKDAYFTFTYGELREILPGDKLASLFESINKKTDDKEVTLSYYEIVSKYGDDYYNQIMALATDEEMAALTANQEAVLDYFNRNINEIKKTGCANVAYDENFWINFDKVVFKDTSGKKLEGQKELKAAFRLYADKALTDIDSYLHEKPQDEATKIGADLTNEIYVFGKDYASVLTMSDLYTDKKTYAVTSSVVPTKEYDLDENGDNAEDADGEYIFVETDYIRTVVINVKPEETAVEKAFSVRDDKKILKKFEVASEYMSVNSVEIGFDPCKITATINAVTDRMTYCTYDKNMIVTANVTFKGPLSQYGDVVIVFPCTSQMTYSFGWEENK
ncbi:MAG: hypothetical protein K5761_07365 [Clostridiales bacterium]|nr:hypothetical protein [Clostridiales bacterium]